MGVVRQQSVLASIYLYLGTALGFVLVFFVYPYFLTQSEIGLIRSFTDFAMILSPFILLGVPNTFVRFAPYFKGKGFETFKTFTWIVFLIGSCLFTSIFLLCLPYVHRLFTGESPILIPYLRWIPFLVFVTGAFQLVRAWFRAEFTTITPTLFEYVILRLMFMLAASLYSVFLLSEKWLIISIISGYSIILLFLLALYWRRFGLSWVYSREILNRTKLIELSAFGVFVILNNATGEFILRLDTLMLASLSGLVATGIYGVSMQLGVIIEMPKRAISQIAFPVLADAWKNNDKVQILDIYHKTSLNQLLTGGLIFVLVWASVNDLFGILPNGQLYQEGIWVVFFIGLAKLIDVSAGCNIEVLQVSDYYKMTFYFRIASIIVAFVTNLFFIPIYGISGAAIASAISYLISNAAMYFFIWWKLDLQPFKMVNIHALIFLLVIHVVGKLLPLDFHPILNIAIRSTFIAFIFSVGIYFLPISADLKSLLKTGLRKVKLLK